MTDRYSYLTVAIDRDIRADDAEALMKAIRQFRGVIGVAGGVADPSVWTAERRVRQELGRGLINVIYPDITKDA